jgi:hypothetical protein
MMLSVPGMGARTAVELLTNVQNISSSACIQTEGCIAGWTILRFELFDVLVEAGFMRDMSTRELEDPLATQRVF